MFFSEKERPFFFWLSKMVLRVDQLFLQMFLVFLSWHVHSSKEVHRHKYLHFGVDFDGWFIGEEMDWGCYIHTPKNFMFSKKKRFYVWPWILFNLNTEQTVQSAGTVEYIDGISAEGKTSPTNVLDLTLNNLIVRLQ